MGSGLAENWVPQIAGPQRPGEPERWVSWIQSARVYLSAQVSRGRLQGTRCVRGGGARTSAGRWVTLLGRLESGGAHPGGAAPGGDLGAAETQPLLLCHRLMTALQPRAPANDSCLARDAADKRNG